MKNCFVLLMLFILLLTPGIHAQHQVGIIGGANIAKLNTVIENVNRDVESITGFCIGAVYSYNFTQNFAIQFEPMYILNGGKILQNAHDPNIDVKVSSINLPLLLKVSLGEKINPYIIGGTSVGIILSSESVSNANTVSLEGDLESVTNTFSFSLTFGAGINIPLWVGNLFIEGRYDLGLTNQIKDGTVEWKYGNVTYDTTELNTNETKFNFRNIQVMIGYSIPIM